MEKKMSYGRKPEGEEWHFIAFIEPMWDVYAKESYNHVHIVKIFSTRPKEGSANYMFGWNRDRKKTVSLSASMGTSLKRLKESVPELFDAVVYELSVSEVWDEMPVMSVEEYEAQTGRKAKTKPCSKHTGINPTGDGWHRIDSFSFDRWDLWVRESYNGWVNLKLVSEIERKKANFTLGWNYRECRFASTADSEKLRTYPELYDHLVKFLKEE